MATKINPVLDGTFTRASQAWLGEPDAMKEFAENVRRVRPKLLVSDPQMGLVVGTLDSGNAVPMFVNHAGELHAVKSAGAGLFKSDDAGDTWTLVTEAAPFDGDSAGHICWRLSNPGVILAFVRVSDSDKRLYYSADDGATWARCVVAGTETPFAFPLIPGFSPDTATGLASFHVASDHGTTIIGDYSNAAGASTADQGQTIYRTTDGRNIEVVLERASGLQKHFHAPGYHAGTGRWLIGYGDAGATRTGTIGTRTGDTEAVLALAAGHAVTTAMKLTVTWAGGRRTAMPVTNVSSNNITVSGGTGDVLPAEGVAIGAVSVMVGCLYSDDDGLTWNELWTPMTLEEQPVSFCDFGHPTLILGGSDKSNSLFALDVAGPTSITRDFYSIGDEFQGNWKGGDYNRVYSFGIEKVLGVYYAPLWCNAADSVATLLVSPDGVQWVPYANMASLSSEFTYGNMSQILGVCGGWIVGRVPGPTVTRVVRWKPATFRTADGLLVEPASTNKLNANQATSPVSGVTGDWSGYAGSGVTLGLSTAAKHHGTNSGYVAPIIGVSSIGPRVQFASGGVLDAGHIVLASVWLTGRANLAAAKWYRRHTNGTFATIGDVNLVQFTNLVSLSRWKRFEWEPVTLPEISGDYPDVVVNMALTRLGDGVTQNAMYVDSAKLTANEPRSEWVPGATTRAADSLLVELPESSDWTLRYDAVIEPGTFDWLAGLGEYAIFALYDPDLENYAVALLYEPLTNLTGRWVFRRWNAAGDPTDSYSDAFAIPRQSPIAIIVRKSKWAYRLDVRSVAGTWSSPMVDSSMESHAITLRAGLRDGSRILPHWFCGGEIEPVCLSDADVTQALRKSSGGLTRAGGASKRVLGFIEI